ncbi:MAG: hypothetical protein HC945_02795 [Nitrosarchaeum sp.]|nr:hypothetical protein [Nitrosarchaeum sp.]
MDKAHFLDGIGRDAAERHSATHAKPRDLEFCIYVMDRFWSVVDKQEPDFKGASVDKDLWSYDEVLDDEVARVSDAVDIRICLSRVTYVRAVVIPVCYSVAVCIVKVGVSGCDKAAGAGGLRDGGIGVG